MEGFVTMDHGSGGVKTSELIDTLLKPAFANAALDALGDGALLPMPAGRKLAFSTDSFVVQPIVFPGGDIGKLAVCGTVNDLAMCGAKPLWLSLSMILEEGLPLDVLARVVQSIAKTAKEAGVQIVTGDTKVVERGHGDGIYLNTAGVGVVECEGLTPDAIREGDQVIVTGPVGDHGAAVMLARNDLGIESDFVSDCMPLHELARAAWEAADGGLRVLRDATRGGVATTLCEFAEGRGFSITLKEADVPVRTQVRAVCELLGLDPLYCANEGRMLAVVAKEKADAVLAALRAVPGGEGAAIIGDVNVRWPGKVTLENEYGANRIITKLTGAQLPRIC
ncbi:MAG: hydrogenase expression/formation protein HypE [Clostridia bacterium]|nr:hydrogenase expression/formation protein HypE [Clostridia bacterium]